MMIKLLRFRSFLSFFACVFACVFLLKCKSVNYNWGGGVIDKLGEYHVQGKGYTIVVFNDNDILRYTVKGIKGTILLQSDENASIFQKWALYWDKQNNLWVKSSDIGNIVWENLGSDKYRKIALKEDTTMEKRMPDILKESGKKGD